MNDIWLGNSPDLNAAEHIGSIVKDKVKAKVLEETGSNRFSYDTLLQHVTNVFKSVENRTQLFVNLLCSYP